MKVLTNHDVIRLAAQMHERIQLTYFEMSQDNPVLIYPVPRGGVPVAYALMSLSPSYRMTESLEQADIIVDDIIDTGATRKRYPNQPFYALINKLKGAPDNNWYQFPWEVGEQGADKSFTDNVVRLLQYIGEDTTREGLRDTPARVAKAWKHWAGGYTVDIPALFTSFEDGGETYNQMILVKNIPFYSHCEHHLAPFFGTATVAYIPNKRIVGLSKINRVVDAFARRLQVQERLTDQIAQALMGNLSPFGVGVQIEARHMCMESRGVCQQGSSTITTSLAGCFYDDASCRGEFLNAVK
jgi:GTP cyclohydrolase IA